MDRKLTNPERQLASVAFIVARSAELQPDRIAIDDLSASRRLTYRELDERVTRLARGLMQRGIARGDIVAAMFWNEHAMVETIFACARIGAIVAPINVRLLPAEVAEYLNDHGCRAIVANADFSGHFANTVADIRILRAGSNEEPAAEWPHGGWQDYEALIAGESAMPLAVLTSFDEP